MVDRQGLDMSETSVCAFIVTLRYAIVPLQYSLYYPDSKQIAFTLLLSTLNLTGVASLLDR